MRYPSPKPIRYPAPRRIIAIAIAVMVALPGGGITGCSSPSRGPETDIVEVERIEVLPTRPQAAADPPPAGQPDGGRAVVEDTEIKTAPAETAPAAEGKEIRPAAEEVPAAPAAN